MAKRGETFPYRVKYQWTNGAKGNNVASSLDDAEGKANRILEYGRRNPDRDVTVSIVRHATGTVVITRSSAGLAPTDEES